jgi:hypothetical protein
MPSSPAERDEFCEYFSGSGAITCMVVRRTAQLCFVRFRTADWGPGYDGFSVYVTAAIFNEHLRPANPHSPGVTNFVQALASEAAAQQQHHSNCRQRTNGQGASVEHRVPHPEKSTITEKLPAAQGNGVKPPPKSAPARGRRAKANAVDVCLYAILAATPG